MKRWWIICCFLFAGVITSAQPRDELLERINQIKQNKEYLYGIGPKFPDQAQAEKEALEELSVHVSKYCQDRQFSFIRNLEDIPEDSVAYISGPLLLYDNDFRSIAYLSKEVLEQAESNKAKIMKSEERKAKVQIFLDSLKNAQFITDVYKYLQEMEADIFAKWGCRDEDYNDQTQAYVNKGYLVYYDESTEAILQILTPLDDKMARHDFISGAPANPLKYKNIIPLWIYIEGYNSNLLP